MFTHTKRFFQLSLITTFTTLFFLGIAGVNTAQAEFLTGIAKATEYCDDGFGGAEKAKLAIPASISVDATSFPFITATVTAGSLGSVSGLGIALAKNTKSGVFIFDGFDTGIELTLSGKYKADSVGTLIRINGIFTSQQVNSSFTCITIGKFKLK